MPTSLSYIFVLASVLVDVMAIVVSSCIWVNLSLTIVRDNLTHEALLCLAFDLYQLSPFLRRLIPTMQMKPDEIDPELRLIY